MTKIFTFLAGQSCRSALNSWAAQQRRPTEDMKVFVMRPPQGPASLHVFFSIYSLARGRKCWQIERVAGSRNH